MALSYEPINRNTDVTNTKTMLHEVIPLTGTIVSGTYGTFPNEDNIKNFTHGMFQSIYDYPYLSSSSNHIFDISLGYDESSPLSSSSATQNSKKMAIYNQFSQLLLGYNQDNGKVEVFESDLDITDDSRQMRECIFISFSRLLSKDQIKKGTFSIQLGSGSYTGPYDLASTTGRNRGGILTLQDLSASTDGTGIGQSVGGEYGVLYDATGSITNPINSASYGVVFYQAGIVVLTASVFDQMYAGQPGEVVEDGLEIQSGSAYGLTATDTSRNIYETFVSSSISGACDGVRHRIYNISYNNTTEINSTIYFCRMPVNKFNYSSNPTYTSASKMVIKNVASDLPVTYVTTIGLYSANNRLLATAKLSEPLRKDPTNEITLRVRLDY